MRQRSFSIPAPGVTRRRFMGMVGLGGLAVAGVSGCGSDSPGGEGEASEFPVSFSFLPNVQYGGFWLADDRDYYADAGLQPTFQTGGTPNAPAPEQLLSSGQAVLAVESDFQRLFNYLAENNDIVIIGAVFQKSPLGLLSLEARPVRTVQELPDARILAQQANMPIIDGVMQANGVTDYTLVPGGIDVGTLLEGQGDALLAFATNQPLVLQTEFDMQEGVDYFFTLFSDLNYHTYSNLILAQREYLDSHTQQVVDFMGGTIRAWQDFLTESDEAAELAVNKYGMELGLDLPVQEMQGQAMIPLIEPDRGSARLLEIDTEFLESEVYESLRLGGIANLPAIDRAVDQTVLQQAYEGLDEDAG